MNFDSIFSTIGQYGVVPAIAVDSVDAALPLADTLLEGGLPVLEITFRTPAAAKVIETIAQKRPELLLGAGTVLVRENLEMAHNSGARFCVAPGLNPELVDRARSLQMPFIPGVATASEVERALSLDCRLLKFFPAEVLGGVTMIKALAGPYKHTGMRLMPTGGVNAKNLQSYLSLDVVAAVGGSWIASREDLAAGNWSDIKARCKEIAEIVAWLRGPCHGN